MFFDCLSATWHHILCAVESLALSGRSAQFGKAIGGMRVMFSTTRRRALSALAGSLIAFAVVCTTSNVAFAETPGADDLDNVVFEGVIRDSAGAVVPSVKIVATHLTTGVERTTVSNAEGRFRISVSTPGSYKLKVTAPGFKEEESQEVAAATGRTF